MGVKWCWSDKAGKWIHVKIIEGEKVYHYRDDPPKEFMDLNTKIESLNKKLMATTDEKKNLKYFKRLMKISQRMQEMRDNSL